MPAESTTMPFAITYYHLIWTTERRQSMIERDHIGIIMDTIYDACEPMGCKIFGLSVMPDHIHIALSIPPRMSVADWVDEIKRVTSVALSEALPNAPIVWGKGFGVVTFGAQNKDKVIRYVKRQYAIHAEDALTEVFERVDE
jgi:REP element-mobilizing transposase RayT